MIMKSLLKIAALSFLAAAMAGLPGQLYAQATNKPTPEKKPAVEKKQTANAEKHPSAHPIRGKLAALDKAAKTITLGKSTYHITPETKITKAGKPATLDDGVLGEYVTGYVKPAEDGKMVAKTLYFGPKPEAKGPEKKKAK